MAESSGEVDGQLTYGRKSTSSSAINCGMSVTPPSSLESYAATTQKKQKKTTTRKQKKEPQRWVAHIWSCRWRRVTRACVSSVGPSVAVATLAKLLGLRSSISNASQIFFHTKPTKLTELLAIYGGGRAAFPMGGRRQRFTRTHKNARVTHCCFNVQVAYTFSFSPSCCEPLGPCRFWWHFRIRATWTNSIRWTPTPAVLWCMNCVLADGIMLSAKTQFIKLADGIVLPLLLWQTGLPCIPVDTTQTADLKQIHHSFCLWNPRMLAWIGKRPHCLLWIKWRLAGGPNGHFGGTSVVTRYYQ